MLAICKITREVRGRQTPGCWRHVPGEARTVAEVNNRGVAGEVAGILEGFVHYGGEVAGL